MNYLDTGENYDNAIVILVDDGVASVAVIFYGLASNVDLFQQRLDYSSCSRIRAYVSCS
jgi:hypothetical protein